MARRTRRPTPTAEVTLAPVSATCPACGNRLYFDYSNFRTLTSLTDYLYLHDNQLASIREAAFAQLTRLRYLNLSSNRLTRLPDSIGCLESLEEFRADDNQLDAEGNGQHAADDFLDRGTLVVHGHDDR